MKNEKEMREYVNEVLGNVWEDRYPELEEAYFYALYLDGFSISTALPTVDYFTIDEEERRILKLEPEFKAVLLFFSDDCCYPEIEFSKLMPDEVEKLAWRDAGEWKLIEEEE